LQFKKRELQYILGTGR